MSKTFFEVFPTLKMDDELRLQFEGVEVEKVATNSRRDYLNIHIFSRHLIQKRYIYAVENAVDELKEIATGMIASNDQDGVAKWLLSHAEY